MDSTVRHAARPSVRKDRGPFSFRARSRAYRRQGMRHSQALSGRLKPDSRTRWSRNDYHAPKRAKLPPCGVSRLVGPGRLARLPPHPLEPAPACASLWRLLRAVHPRTEPAIDGCFHGSFTNVFEVKENVRVTPMPSYDQRCVVLSFHIVVELEYRQRVGELVEAATVRCAVADVCHIVIDQRGNLPSLFARGANRIATSARHHRARARGRVQTDAGAKAAGPCLQPSVARRSRGRHGRTLPDATAPTLNRVAMSSSAHSFRSRCSAAPYACEPYASTNDRPPDVSATP